MSNIFHNIYYPTFSSKQPSMLDALSRDVKSIMRKKQSLFPLNYEYMHVCFITLEVEARIREVNTLLDKNSKNWEHTLLLALI